MSPTTSPPKTTVAPSPQAPTVPAHIRPLLGPGWLVEGEEPQLYEELLARVGAAVGPQDIIDWLLLKDVVALSWEIQRARRQRDALMRSQRKKAMVKLLGEVYPRCFTVWPSDREQQIETLAADWFAGGKKAGQQIGAMLKEANLALADVAPQTLSVVAEELGRIDGQTHRQEDRRDKILQQIERRRAGWSHTVRRASEEIVDAEFAETPPQLAEEGAGTGAAQ